MYLYIAHPEGLPYPNTGIEEVGPRIAVELARAFHFHLQPLGSPQVALQ